MTKSEWHTLRKLLDDLKREALRFGQYKPYVWVPDAFDLRDRSKAFTCGAYVSTVRQIHVLEKLLREDLRRFLWENEREGVQEIKEVREW